MNDGGGVGVVVAVVVEEEEAVCFDVGDSHEAWRWVVSLYPVKFTNEAKLVTNQPTDGPADGRTDRSTDGRTHPLIEILRHI